MWFNKHKHGILLFLLTSLVAGGFGCSQGRIGHMKATSAEHTNATESVQPQEIMLNISLKDKGEDFAKSGSVAPSAGEAASTDLGPAGNVPVAGGLSGYGGYGNGGIGGIGGYGAGVPVGPVPFLAGPWFWPSIPFFDGEWGDDEDDERVLRDDDDSDCRRDDDQCHKCTSCKDDHEDEDDQCHKCTTCKDDHEDDDDFNDDSHDERHKR